MIELSTGSARPWSQGCTVRTSARVSNARRTRERVTRIARLALIGSAAGVVTLAPLRKRLLRPQVAVSGVSTGLHVGLRF